MAGRADPGLLARAKAGVAEAREAFVRQNLGLVRTVVARLAPRAAPEDVEDLFQAGCLGLLKAIDGFEPGYGTQFSTYAVPTILGEIRRQLRQGGPLKVGRSLRDLATKARRAAEVLRGRLGREPSVAEVGAAIGENAEDIVVAFDSLSPVVSLDAPAAERVDERTLGEKLSTGEDPEEAYLDRVSIREALAELPARQREIIYWRFFHDRSQTQVAVLLGLSQAQVSRLEREAFQRLRQRLEA